MVPSGMSLISLKESRGRLPLTVAFFTSEDPAEEFLETVEIPLFLFPLIL